MLRPQYFRKLFLFVSKFIFVSYSGYDQVFFQNEKLINGQGYRVAGILKLVMEKVGKQIFCLLAQIFFDAFGIIAFLGEYGFCVSGLYGFVF